MSGNEKDKSPACCGEWRGKLKMLLAQPIDRISEIRIEDYAKLREEILKIASMSSSCECGKVRDILEKCLDSDIEKDAHLTLFQLASKVSNVIYWRNKEIDTLKAECARLREALEKYASSEHNPIGRKDIAREALATHPKQPKEKP